jgi:hypothetical protein
MTSYSGTTLAKKLGIKENFKIRLINIPIHYQELFTDWPDRVGIIENPEVKKDFIHLFIKHEIELFEFLPPLKEEIEQNGMIWVSWQKKTSKIRSDVNENVIRKVALETGLVDVKVCSVDEVWSGLKLVIPLKSRKPVNPYR